MQCIHVWYSHIGTLTLSMHDAVYHMVDVNNICIILVTIARTYIATHRCVKETTFT